MLVKFIKLSLLLTFFCIEAFSQTDSTGFVADTIVYIPDTVVIKSTFYLPKTKRLSNSSANRYAGIAYSTGKDFIGTNNTFVKYNDISTINIFVGMENNKLYTDIGLGLMQLTANLSGTTYSLQQRDSTAIGTDTIDIYYQIENGIKVPKYVTKDKNVTYVFTSKKETPFSVKVKLSYIQIPINVTYLFSIGKFKL